MFFKIDGNPYVKKSNQRVINRGGRSVKIDTPRYREWRHSALWQLKAQEKPSEPIDFPINLECHFYKSNKGRVDLSALYEGIQDVLVEVGVLADDNYLIVAGHDGSRVHVDRDNPRMEITITQAGKLAPPRPLKQTKPKKEEEPF